jgi:hypothetical protein
MYGLMFAAARLLAAARWLVPFKERPKTAPF